MLIYQIYPRSFQDSNGDGIGDLPGICSRLAYIRSLGVDTIWISPVFKSPMRDFGYDVSDYRSVDPIFGAPSDLHRLIDEARKLDMAVRTHQTGSIVSRSARSGQRNRWPARCRRRPA